MYLQMMDILNEAWTNVTSSSFNLTLWIMIILSVALYVLSFIHTNYSWVDRSWSIAPVVYTWIHAYYKIKNSTTTSLLNNAVTMYAIIVTLWGIRLTFNFARRGGYRRGGQDYRWEFVRNQPGLSNPVVWEIYSFWMIAVLQTALIWAIALPMIAIPSASITSKDVLFGVAIIVFIIFETVCDEQQQRFQRLKREKGKRTEALSYGFCVTGVFGYSRHLNVFCEGCIWVTLAVAAYAHGRLECWQGVGCVLLELLTWYSTACVTEKLTLQKYPMYKIYQTTTPMLFPSVKSSTARTLHLLRQKASNKE